MEAIEEERVEREGIEVVVDEMLVDVVEVEVFEGFKKSMCVEKRGNKEFWLIIGDSKLKE